MSPVLAPGADLLHYRILERIGAGGMGVVWKALDTTLDREVAVKVLPEALSTDPEYLARFEREARLLASLNHPNVAILYGLHEASGVRFLAMELVRGRTLADEITRGLTTGRLLELAVPIADGLAAAHRQNIVHRDIKPENILIGEEGAPKILDFGLARSGPIDRKTDSSAASTVLQETTATRAGTLLGTVAYMSPEQAQGMPVDARSDIFSLGVVLYEMATGRRPFGGNNAVTTLTAILRDQPPPIRDQQPASPPALERIIRRCLEKDPGARYADAAELREDLRALQSGTSMGTIRIDRVHSPRPRASARWIGAAVLTLLLAIAAGAWWKGQAARSRARAELLPQLTDTVDRIQGMQEGRESWDAWLLARSIESTLPADPVVEKLRPRFSRPVWINSTPPGATVDVWYYGEPDAEPIRIGTTPILDFAYPRGYTRIRLSVPGKEPVDDVVWNISMIKDHWEYRLHDAGGIADGMAWIPADTIALYLPGLDDLQAEPTAPFAMDRHEVTNREFREFVAAGGYRDPKYWREPFTDKEREISRDEAMARFVDGTGQPGPATWEVGEFTQGEGDFPVSGVSWYEAAAYAAWAGKSLPTVFHWNLVAFTMASAHVVPMSNLAGNGPVATGGTRSANRYGVSDLAGNVREWTWNGTGGNRERFILGGGWSDPDYAFTDAYAQPPMDRSPLNGFRCILMVEAEPNRAALERSLDRPERNFLTETPVSDQVFAQFLRQFAYDRKPLNATLDEEKSTPEGLRQKISFDAAYGGERVTAYLFLPPAGHPPYQVVVLFPGSGSITTRSSETLELGRVDFLTRGGRAVIWPIYKGTYERGDDRHADFIEGTTDHRDYMIMWARDLGRSIDYLETRPDIDSRRLAYYGLSWGGALGAILPAVEPRIKVNILYVAGLTFQHALPEVDQINYVSRVRQPTLLLNGELDYFFPAETSQRPMFELLGTPAADKKRLVFPGGHSVPRTEMIRESLAWLDKYLGPVGDGETP